MKFFKNMENLTGAPFYPDIWYMIMRSPAFESSIKSCLIIAFAVFSFLAKYAGIVR